MCIYFTFIFRYIGFTETYKQVKFLSKIITNKFAIVCQSSVYLILMSREYLTAGTSIKNSFSSNWKNNFNKYYKRL